MHGFIALHNIDSHKLEWSLSAAENNQPFSMRLSDIDFLIARHIRKQTFFDFILIAAVANTAV